MRPRPAPAPPSPWRAAWSGREALVSFPPRMIAPRRISEHGLSQKRGVSAPSALHLAQHDDDARHRQAVLVFVDVALDRFDVESVGPRGRGHIAAAMHEATALPQSVERGHREGVVSLVRKYGEDERAAG